MTTENTDAGIRILTKPELPRWERLLLNGLTLPELAKDAADERDRLARDAERWHLAYVGESIRVSELEAELADRGSQCNR